MCLEILPRGQLTDAKWVLEYPGWLGLAITFGVTGKSTSSSPACAHVCLHRGMVPGYAAQGQTSHLASEGERKDEGAGLNSPSWRCAFFWSAHLNPGARPAVLQAGWVQPAGFGCCSATTKHLVLGVMCQKGVNGSVSVRGGQLGQCPSYHDSRTSEEALACVCSTQKVKRGKFGSISSYLCRHEFRKSKELLPETPIPSVGLQTR